MDVDMNWTIIIIETIILTAAFTAMILIPLMKNPVWWIADYPADIQEEYFKTHERIPSKFFTPTVLLKKGMALIITLVLLLVVVRLAGAYDFWSALWIGYGMWLFIDWYDCFFLDWVLFANMKKVRLPGTEHMDEAYHQKKYHFVQSCWGMLIGLIPCLIGAAVFAWLFCGVSSLNDLKSEYVTMNDSISIHYKTYGDGDKTICFVHGFGCDLNTWEKQFECLRNDDNLRLLFLDLPGYGASSKPHVDYTIDFFAQAVNKVLDKNNVDAVTLVGHSLGTPVCRHTLMNYHKGNLVDVDGVYCFYDGTETPEYIEAVQQFGHAFDGPDCKEVITGFVMSLAGPDTPQEITDYAMSVMPKTPQYVASSTMRNLVERQWWPDTPFEGRATVICTQNSGLNQDNRQKMERLYPNLDYTELTTCGHFIQMELGERFNEKLKQFVL